MTRPRRALLAAVLLTMTAAAGSVPAAQAQGPACTITWTGAAGNRWFDMIPNGAGTADDVYSWNQQRYPDSTDHACFPTGANANTNQVTQNTPDVSSFTISAGASLSITDVQLIARENSFNAGTLNMSGSVPLTVNDSNTADGSEGLTNTATGTINFTPQLPANGSITAIVSELFTNHGTVNVNDPEASIQGVAIGINTSAVHSNQGTINISAGNALRSIFCNFINSGAITGAGSMNTDQIRFEAASGGSIAAATDVNMTNSIIAGVPGSTGSGRIDVVGAFSGGGPSTLEGTVPAGITLDVDGGVTLRAPAVTTTVNAGRINLTGDGPSNGSQLQVLPNDVGTNSTSKLTNAPTGVIEFTSGGNAGFKFITGNLVNEGTILVNHPQARFQFPGGTNTPPTLTNQGTISVSASGVLAAILDAIVVNAAGSPTGGVINGAGAVNVSAQRVEIGANSQIGGGIDFNIGSGTALAFVGPATGATGNLDITSGTINLTGTVPSGIALDIDGSATLRSNTSFTNAGAINLIGNSALATENGVAGDTETLTNTGTVTSSGSGGVAAISGDLINQGQLTAGHPTTRFDSQQESRSPTLTNTATGTISVPAGGVLASFPGEAQAIQNAGTVQVSGTLAPLGYTQTAGQTTLATAPPTHSIGIPAGSGVVTIQGGTLRGSGIINADVVNSGGTVAPGASPGTLSILRNYTQGAGGTLAVEVAGADPGTGYDRLDIDGTVSLAGTLSIATAGFTPATGQQFKIIDAPAPPTAPTVSGSFDTVQENGRDYDVAVNPTDVTLTALAPPQPPPDDDGDGTPNSSDNCPNQAGPASNGGCPVVSQPADDDGDGTPNSSDNCPTQAGAASNGGCPAAALPPAAACDAAEDQLAKAKKKLRKLKKKDASAAAIKKAKKKVKKAKDAVAQAC